MKKYLFINFKNYKTGNEVVVLAQKISHVSQEKNVTVILALAATDIALVAEKINTAIFAQHVERYDVGRHMGFVLAASVKNAGARGTFLNHSEHPLSILVLQETMR